MLLTLLWSTDLFQNTFSVMFPYYIKSQAKKQNNKKKFCQNSFAYVLVSTNIEIVYYKCMYQSLGSQNLEPFTFYRVEVIPVVLHHLHRSGFCCNQQESYV